MCGADKVGRIQNSLSSSLFIFTQLFLSLLTMPSQKYCLKECTIVTVGVFECLKSGSVQQLYAFPSWNPNDTNLPTLPNGNSILTYFSYPLTQTFLNYTDVLPDKYKCLYTPSSCNEEAERWTNLQKTLGRVSSLFLDEGNLLLVADLESEKM